MKQKLNQSNIRIPQLHRSSAEASATSSPKQQLQLKELKSKRIPLIVSEKLQNQIFFLCSEVFSDEWSGTLFYKVEGDLGEDNFKIFAEELYLQDIGNSTYTEYDPGNPQFIKFLMENPRFLEMKQGHIHSHNTMNVFFSGTDSDELKENSEFHNYYLSLIVNNKNEMTAKVAFRATEKRVTNSTVSFRGNDGTFRQKEIKGETEETSVYSYNCDIEIPDFVGESFAERFQEVAKAKEEKRKLAQQAAAITKNVGGAPSGLKPPVDPYQGWDGKKGYSQIGLYDDVRPEGKRGEKEKGKGGDRGWQREREKDNKRGGQVSLPPDYAARREWSGSVGKKEKESEVDVNVYSFLVKLLSRDFIAEGSLGRVMESLNKQFYKEIVSSTVDEALTNEDEKNMYMDTLDDLAISYYVDSFPDDFHVTGFNKALDKAMTILECFDEQYPELVLDLITALTMAKD